MKRFWVYAGLWCVLSILCLLIGCRFSYGALIDGDIVPVDTYISAWNPDKSYANDAYLKVRPGVSVGLMNFKMPIGAVQVYVASKSNPQVVRLYAYEVQDDWPLELTWNDWQALDLLGDPLDSFEVSLVEQWYTIQTHGASSIALIADGGAVEIKIASFNHPQQSARPIIAGVTPTATQFPTQTALPAPTKTRTPTPSPTQTPTQIAPTRTPTRYVVIWPSALPTDYQTPPSPPEEWFTTPTPGTWQADIYLVSPDGETIYLELIGVEIK